MSFQSSLYPVFIDLKGKSVLVVGGGKIACRKIGHLLQAGPEITVVCTEYDTPIGLLADKGLIKLFVEPFSQRFLDNMWLVIAATDDNQVNRQVFELAEQRRILCNVVDVPSLCRFQVPAIVKRGDLQLAISTAGKSPAYAKYLKKQLNSQFGRDVSDKIKILDQVRNAVKLKFPDSIEMRTRINNLAVESPLLNELCKGEMTIDFFVSCLSESR
ncbi:MAG: bifunctional precorrin-2 dehydrogenase/sirohydrochlorin ferrochelatase [Sedimentisphaerales bacterium]|nr:bifunctional precorrin-2 dehydrogenase/sirohydrochlorin ferrochelatase [Sedimentisphaerales bacterium]MBN2842524.1 bifunctional precorrin-2 dehydrogenase/sirohydrochlorin ferrochelatase [Sedimentisphaerales bacterium]